MHEVPILVTVVSLPVDSLYVVVLISLAESKQQQGCEKSPHANLN